MQSTMANGHRLETKTLNPNSLSEKLSL